MKILVTGAAGFIGSAVAGSLLERGDEVVGVDNHNGYYDPELKDARVARQINQPRYTHLRVDISDEAEIAEVFEAHQPQRVVHLAAQAGVRYSLKDPFSYIRSNMVGFGHILEGCRQLNVEHLVYASSSSVYGANTDLPFSIGQNIDHPLNLYAASKKANELMAHSYSHLYRLPTTGLRFFTVYGPWGRPDMALFGFTKAILADQPIQVFNYGKHTRDFTYIDDIVEGVVSALDRPAAPNPTWTGAKPDPASSLAPWRVYNLGNNRPVSLATFISAIETALGKAARVELMPLQSGDVLDTSADIEESMLDLNFQPRTSIEDGIGQFVNWYRDYYRV